MMITTTTTTTRIIIIMTPPPPLFWQVRVLVAKYSGGVDGVPQALTQPLLLDACKLLYGFVEHFPGGVDLLLP
jgi:hypothetical protein